MKDITELKNATAAAYKEMKKYRKNSNKYKELFKIWAELHSQFTKEVFSGNVQYTI